MEPIYKKAIEFDYCPPAIFSGTPEQILAWCNFNMDHVLLDPEFHMVIWRAFLTHLNERHPVDEFFRDLINKKELSTIQY